MGLVVHSIHEESNSLINFYFNSDSNKYESIGYELQTVEGNILIEETQDESEFNRFIQVNGVRIQTVDPFTDQSKEYELTDVVQGDVVEVTYLKSIDGNEVNTLICDECKIKNYRVQE